MSFKNYISANTILNETKRSEAEEKEISKRLGYGVFSGDSMPGIIAHTWNSYVDAVERKGSTELSFSELSNQINTPEFAEIATEKTRHKVHTQKSQTAAAQAKEKGQEAEEEFKQEKKEEREAIRGTKIDRTTVDSIFVKNIAKTDLSKLLGTHPPFKKLIASYHLEKVGEDKHNQKRLFGGKVHVLSTDNHYRFRVCSSDQMLMVDSKSASDTKALFDAVIANLDENTNDQISKELNDVITAIEKSFKLGFSKNTREQTVTAIKDEYHFFKKEFDDFNKENKTKLSINSTRDIKKFRKNVEKDEHLRKRYEEVKQEYGYSLESLLNNHYAHIELELDKGMSLQQIAKKELEDFFNDDDSPTHKEILKLLLRNSITGAYRYNDEAKTPNYILYAMRTEKATEDYPTSKKNKEKIANIRAQIAKIGKKGGDTSALEKELVSLQGDWFGRIKTFKIDDKLVNEIIDSSELKFAVNCTGSEVRDISAIDPKKQSSSFGSASSFFKAVLNINSFEEFLDNSTTIKESAKTIVENTKMIKLFEEYCDGKFTLEEGLVQKGKEVFERFIDWLKKNVKPIIDAVFKKLREIAQASITKFFQLIQVLFPNMELHVIRNTFSLADIK